MIRLSGKAGGHPLSARLRSVTVPTLVIHGCDDRVVAASRGRATARTIPNAHSREIGGMGNAITRHMYPTVAAAISAHMAQTDGNA
jgi:pimeloyl-ACP methyl ester carboxylesterase